MRLLFKRLLLNGTIALACLGCDAQIAAPIAAAHTDEAPRRGGTLRLASFGDIRSLDPVSSADALSATVTELIFAGIVDYDASGKVVPDLAERWEVDDDGTTYRFFLREGVRFQDGEEVTAEDVKRSVERALHPSTPNAFASAYETLRGYADYTEKKTAEHLDGVRIEGKYVVSFRLKERDATFLPALGLQSLRPTCRSAGARFSDTWHPCGAGPFKLPPGGWERGRSVTVVRNENYFKPGLPHLDAITWAYGMNIITERFKFEAGELDSIREMSQADLIKFQSDPRWKPFGRYEPDRTIYGQGMNVEMAPFDNVEVRRAVAAAIDREKFRLVKPGTLRAAYQLLPPAVPGYRDDLPKQKYDLDAALEHMRRAGYPFDSATGKGGWPGVVPYYAYKAGMLTYTGQLLQQDLAKIGIRIEIRMINYPTWLALSHRRKRVALTEAGWEMDYPDPADFFENLFASKAINDEDTANTSFYKNDEVDRLLETARKELDPEKRMRLYGDVDRIVCDEAPWAFTHSNQWYVVWQPYVKGFRTHALWTQDVAGVWLDRAGEARARREVGWRDALGSIFGTREGRR
jgi:ABC-type transport system substrate-binding protein